MIRAYRNGGAAMDLQTLLDQRQITKYHLSKVSGVPKTTIMDICAGRSEIERCSAKTVQQLAKALGCTMEDIMNGTATSATCNPASTWQRWNRS